MKRNKSEIKFVEKEDGESSRLYWEKKSAEERLSAVEFLREQYYIIQGYKAIPRIIRELRIVEGSD